MARSFFKKRRIAGPSKNELKVQRDREAAARERSASRLGQLFPGVERVSVQLDLLSPQQQPLADRETRVFGANDVCDFSVPCPGRCGEGSFDLAGKVQALVEGRQASSEASGVCQEPLYAGASEVCGVQLKCRIDIAYAPQEA